ncbi:MAG: ABC transporter ATP-binding protein [Solobacterium sp.]|nr:ABC transporter ATP-binding protein [Solobacterium sp.]
MTQKTAFESRTSLILYFLEGSKKYFAMGILMTSLVSLVDFINPKIISYTVDTVLGTEPSSLPERINAWLEGYGGPAFLRTHLLYIAAAVVLLGLTGALFRFGSQLFNVTGAEKLVKRMRDTLFGHLLYLPYAWYAENHTGDIIQRSTSDVETVKMFLSEQLTSLFRTVLMLVLAVGFMLSINVSLTIVSCAFIPIIVSYSFFFHRHIGSTFEVADEEEARLSFITQENLTGVRVVRAFGREKEESVRFRAQNDKYTEMWIRLMKLLSAFWCTGDFFMNMQLLSVLALGSWLCAADRLTVGNFIAFLAYNSMLIWPVRSLGRVISGLSRAGVSIDRIRFIMNAPVEEDAPDALEEVPAGDIVFDHVSFRYREEGPWILEDISLTIKEGSTVGILGATGYGKTTLAALIDRMYELPPENGTITIGGTDIRDLKRSSLRRAVGFVLQEPYLFSRTLKENLLIAADDPDESRLAESVSTAALEETIQDFPEGYGTFVGERGVTLSGGQKQRTAIAQTLMKHSPVVIFDDALSAVDAATDAKIRAALKKNLNHTTKIFISHRLTTLMDADEIFVIQQGRIAEHGSHEQLLQQDGIYRRIYSLQSAQEAEW